MSGQHCEKYDVKWETVHCYCSFFRGIRENSIKIRPNISVIFNDKITCLIPIGSDKRKKCVARRLQTTYITPSSLSSGMFRNNTCMMNRACRANFLPFRNISGHFDISTTWHLQLNSISRYLGISIRQHFDVSTSWQVDKFHFPHGTPHIATFWRMTLQERKCTSKR